jgi:hypothetical protein
LRHEFSLSDTQLGGLFTLFTVVFALAGLPLGKLTDARRRGWPRATPCPLGTRLGNNVGTAFGRFHE